MIPPTNMKIIHLKHLNKSSNLLNSQQTLLRNPLKFEHPGHSITIPAPKHNRTEIREELRRLLKDWIWSQSCRKQAFLTTYPKLRLPPRFIWNRLQTIFPPVGFNRNPGNSLEVVRSDPRQTLPSSSNKLPQSMAVQMVPVFFPINGSVCMAYMERYQRGFHEKRNFKGKWSSLKKKASFNYQTWSSSHLPSIPAPVTPEYTT